MIHYLPVVSDMDIIFVNYDHNSKYVFFSNKTHISYADFRLDSKIIRFLILFLLEGKMSSFMQSSTGEFSSYYKLKNISGFVQYLNIKQL